MPVTREMPRREFSAASISLRTFCRLLTALVPALFTVMPLSSAQSINAWGYIHHISHLSPAYLKKTLPDYSVISVTGFNLTSDGSLIRESVALVNQIKILMHIHRGRLYPLISFHSMGAGRKLLYSKPARTKAVRSINALIREFGFSGVHLDFEYLPPEDSGKLAAFLSELRSSQFRGNITMAIFPQVGFPEKWSGFHDLKAISSYLDEIVLMCYDLHGPHTGPGPVTDPAWAEKNIRAVLPFINAGRIWLGMPAYGYQWCNGRPSVISARHAVTLAPVDSAERDSSANLQYTFKKNKTTCRVYSSDRKTRASLTRLAADYGLAGIAIWRLGLED